MSQPPPPAEPASAPSDPIEGEKGAAPFSKAVGTIRCWGSKFATTFPISGHLFIFAGTLSGNQALFDSIKVTMYYAGVYQLQGPQIFSGSIGVTDFRLALPGSVTLSGTLSEGEQIIPVINATNAQGTWFYYA